MKKYSKIAFIFPGQGAQYPGMGKDFAEQFPLVKETYEEANDLLHRKISELIWHGSENDLKNTHTSQPGIYTTSIAFSRLLQKQFPHFQPSFCAGLSLGEYTALTRAEILSFPETLILVDKRGQFMQDACTSTKGGMSVILGLDASVVENIVEEAHLPHDLWAANFNCPGQVVISGTEKGLEIGTIKAKERGAKRVIPLPVHGAFHSGLMQQAEDRLKDLIIKAPFKKSSIGIFMNQSGTQVNDVEEMKRQLIKQVTSPVRWEQSIRAMAAEGVDLFIEIGCGKTLAGMNKKIGLTVPTFSIDKIEDLESFAKEMAS